MTDPATPPSVPVRCSRCQVLMPWDGTANVCPSCGRVSRPEPPSVPACPACKAPLDDEHNLRSGAVCPTLEPPPYEPLRCTACGSTLSPLLEYVPGSYSEHRNHTGYECDDCNATWDRYGEPTPGKPTEQTPDALCANCGGGIVEGYHHPWLHVGGWLLCPALPGEDKPSRIATPPTSNARGGQS